MLFDIKRNPFSYLLLLPAAVYTFVFGYITLPYIIIAFEKFNYKKGIWLSEWVGFKNFEFFFKSSSAWTVTWNTVYLNFLFIVTGTITALIFSILLNELVFKRFTKIVQSTFLFPNFLSWIIVSYIVYALFSTQYGVVNEGLKAVGLNPTNWYTDADAWTWILVGLKIWKDAGISIVIYLAAIAGIDQSLYEAAIVDGANRWQQIKNITLPLLMPTVAILNLLAVGKIFNGDFGMIYALVGDNALLYKTTDVIDTYVYRALRRTGDPSQAMAVGLFQSLVGFILVFGVNKITKKFYPDGAIF
ncbi:ABC transporter permease [Cohnella suwonensis]|uniref:ABC transporter permease n=1 Tax=Cohnella suwonensis TaxID=696072 RepID=A0ABW0LQN5_9BACL